MFYLHLPTKPAFNAIHCLFPTTYMPTKFIANIKHNPSYTYQVAIFSRKFDNHKLAHKKKKKRKMFNMSKFLVYLLVCISLHACSARPIASIDDNENKIILSSKDVTILTSDISKTEGRIIMSEDIGKDDGKLMWKKRSIVTRKEDEKNNKGNKVKMTSFHEGAHQVKISRRESRLMLESPPSTQHEEEAVNSIEKEPVEDVEVMDYAQPHRKPPIHNTKH